MKTLHIINSNHSLSLKEHLLQDSNALIHTEVLPFDIAFKMDQNSQELLVQAYDIIQTLDLEVLKESALNPTNIESYLRFIKEMHLYGISTNHLPLNTLLQQDNKKIIQHLMSLVKSPVLESGTMYVAYDHYLSHSEKYFLEANHIPIQKHSPVQPHKTYHKTLNIRHEIEAALQDVITKKLTHASFVVPSLKERIPLIESIFKRYGFNLNLSDNTPLINRKKFISLLNLITQPSIDHLINTLENHALGGFLNQDIIYLIQMMDLSMPLPREIHSSNQDIQNIIDGCRADYNLLIDQLDEITFGGSFEERVKNTYQSLSTNQNNLNLLRKFIEENLHLYDDSTSHLFIYQLEKVESLTIENEHFKFYDLNDFSFNNEAHVYALDMSSKNYPALGPNTGVLDDAYRNQVTGYPSLQVRTAHALECKATFIHRSEHLWLSYAYTNYEGKGQEPSFELFGNATSIPIAPVEQILKKERHELILSKAHVHHLLMDQGRINASITALEQYQKDPLLFLIERGFKYRKPEYPSFGPMELGNINHNDIESYLSSKEMNMDAWYHFPKSLRMKMIQYRNKDIMDFSKTLINQSIEISALKPKYFEYSFKNATLFNHFVINGKIDRIDQNEDYFIIYDYKSSETRLVNKSIQNGEQLQLLTYALIYNELRKENNEDLNQLLGVFYFSLRPKNISFSNYKYTRGKGLEKLEKNVMADIIKERSYKGYFFDDITDLFEEEGYHQSIVRSASKKDFGTIKLRGTPYNVQTTQRVLEGVYDRIYRSISQGDFEYYKVRKNLRPTQYFSLTKDYDEQVKGDQ